MNSITDYIDGHSVVPLLVTSCYTMIITDSKRESWSLELSDYDDVGESLTFRLPSSLYAPLPLPSSSFPCAFVINFAEWWQNENLVFNIFIILMFDS